MNVLQKKNKIRALVFDCEGVLIDTEPFWDASQIEFLAAHNKIYDRDSIKHLLTGRSFREGTAILARMYDLQGTLDELLHQRMQITFASFQREIHMIPGVQAFIEKYAYRIPLGIATAMAPDLFDIVVRHAHFPSYFSAISTLRDTQGKGKPDPSLFLHCASQLAVSPVQCLVIEDAPLGIEAAHNAGMRCAAITTTYAAKHLQQADIIVENFEDLAVWILENEEEEERRMPPAG